MRGVSTSIQALAASIVVFIFFDQGLNLKLRKASYIVLLNYGSLRSLILG